MATHYLPDKHIHWEAKDREECPVCSEKIRQAAELAFEKYEKTFKDLAD